MARIVYICTRNSQPSKLTEAELQKLAHRLAPDHISEAVLTITEHDGITISIFTSSEAVIIRGASIALGNLETDTKKWWKPGTEVPDGAYALFRGDPEAIEVVTDVVASRSIWYVHTEKLFIASTSQRAIIGCLRSYEPNPKVYPWILSSGCLGPDLSWDRRIRKLRGDSRLLLERRSWQLSERTQHVIFECETTNEQVNERQLKNMIQTTFERLNLDWNRWVLALSGGYDSRCSLIMLEDRLHLKCITWGEYASLYEPDSDAHIARQLARKYGHHHEYFVTDLSEEPINQLFDRILMASEGRIDHINASMDGFVRYKQMHDAGILGLIRSDEGFGWQPVTFETDVRESVGLTLLSDYSKEAGLCTDDLEPQELPGYLHRRTGESLSTWRDRLYQEFRIPCVLAGLSEPRLNYVEQANPLISRRIILTVRALPDHLRTDKALFKRVVNRIVPDVPIATKDSVAPLRRLLSHQEIRSLFLDELGTQHGKKLLPPEILNYALRHLTEKNWREPSVSGRLSSILVQQVPVPLKRILRAGIRKLRKPMIDVGQLTLRCFIICRMHEILNEDARSLN